MEKDYRSLFEKHGFGSTVWSPLAQGFLSGRYNDGEIPEDSRIKKWDPFWSNTILYRYFVGKKKDEIMRVGQGLATIAKELGCTQAQLALAWVLASHDVSTLIIGFSKVEQLEENVKAIEIYQKWNKDLEARIQTLLGNNPEPRIDFRCFAPLPQRRDIAIQKK